MTETLLDDKETTVSMTVRIPHHWLPQIEHLQKLQGIKRREQIRELIQIGGDHIGLDLT
jgi:hypothetical protein